MCVLSEDISNEEGPRALANSGGAPHTDFMASRPKRIALVHGREYPDQRIGSGRICRGMQWGKPVALSSSPESESVDEDDEDEAEHEDEKEGVDEESESLVISLPLSALDNPSSSLPACRSSKTPRPRFWKNKGLIGIVHSFLFFALTICIMRASVSSMCIDIDAPWVSASDWAIWGRNCWTRARTVGPIVRQRTICRQLTE